MSSGDLEDVPIVSALEDDSDDDTKKKPRTRWEWFLESLTVGVRASVIVGVVFTLFQYNASVNRERTQRSFELVDLWESDRMQVAHTTLEAKLDALQDEASVILVQDGSSKDPLFMQKLIAGEFLEQSKMDKDLAAAYSSVLYFLNRVANCATSDLCDAEVLNDFFRDYAQQFWEYFGENLSKEVRGNSHPIEKYLTGQANAGG